MARKKKFLSIGEVSKYTRVGVDSLLYYERIKLLKPAFVDPDSSYRYYSFDQIYLVEIIRQCVDLDIPLKELTRFIDESGTFDYFGLLEYGRKIAQSKLESLQKSLKFIGEFQKRIAHNEKHRQGGKIYAKEIPRKYFYVTPCKNSFRNSQPFEVVKSSLDLYHFKDNYDNLLYSYLLEYGFLCLHSPSKTEYFMFVELPEHVAATVPKNIMEIPAGVYFCAQSVESRLENTSSIFGDYLNAEDSFLAIEIEAFTGRYKINSPVNELRVIVRGQGVA